MVNIDRFKRDLPCVSKASKFYSWVLGVNLKYLMRILSSEIRI